VGQISPALAVWNNRQKILESRDRLRALCEAVDWQNDLALYQWVQWFAIALEFKPDLIIELGRGRGNSTCVFTEAANSLPHCRVVSLCNSPDWDNDTKLRVAPIVSAQWFEPLEAKVTDILATDIQALLGDSQRILVLWDAHGYEIAEFMLSYMMPLLRSRQHLVIMHDISDMRYISVRGDYQGEPLWKGGNASGPRLILGHLNSAVEQAVSILDFTSRNHLTLHSADESLHTELTDEQMSELQQNLGKELFSKNGHWFWFSLNEKDDSETIYFPNPSSKQTEPDHSPAQLQQTQAQVNQLQEELVRSHTQLQNTQSELNQLRGLVSNMENTKFWKLRTAWLRLKQTAGLTRGE
jgi:hypothetical protein